MTRKGVAGVLALVAVSSLGLMVSTSLRPPQGPTTHYVSAAPQNKFGFQEAMRPALHSMDVAAPPAVARAAAEAASAAADASVDISPVRPEAPAAIPVGLPRMAYTFDYGFQVDADKLAALQRQHADMCEAQGPRGCRILELEQSRDNGGSGLAHGRLKLAVASNGARKFGAQLASTLGAVGGKEVSASISGEDLSKDMVDTEARLRARSLLRDRLMDVLATRKGSVAELVEAERGVAQVNEEIDEARSWLAEMQARVEFSVLTIDYQPVGATLAPEQSNGFLDPIKAALGNIGGVLGMTLALLITLLTIGVPLLGLVLALRRSWPWLRARLGLAEPASLVENV